ncbi:MAG: Calx-beta domain-containing protein, partial [Pseudomonadota bacterium]
DNDNASVTSNDVTVNEADGTATFTATLDPSVPGGLSVETVFTDGTAVNGVDYTGVPATLNFVGNAGETQNIVVSITDDLIVEANETFVVSLTNLIANSAPVNAIDITDTGLGTIIDNDAATLTINDVTVNEADGTATFTATLDNPVQGGLSVETVFTDGTAINGTDYTGIPVTLNFIGNAGEVQTITVNINDDLIVEANETFTVSLTNLIANSASVNAIDISDTALGTILNNDTANVNLSGDVIVNEAVGSLTFTATLDNPVQGGFTVETAFTDITAINNIDYVGVPEILTFTGIAGEVQSFDVFIKDDQAVESNETFVVSLTDVIPTNPLIDILAIDINDTATVTIVNNDVTITDNPGLNPVLDPANFPYYVEDAFNLLDPYVYYLTTYEFFDFFEYQLIKPGIILQGVDILGWDNGYYQYKGAGYILAERYVNYENFSFQITLDAIARTEYFINEPLINLLNITLPEPPAAPPEQNFFDEGGIFAEDQFEENVADPEQDAAKEPPDQIQQDLFDDSLQQPGSDNVNEPLSEPQQEDFQSDVFDDTTALEEQISFNEKNNTNIILDALTAKQPLVTTKLVFSEQLQQEYARLHDAELK